MADEIVDVGLEVEGDAVFSAMSAINKQIGEMQKAITEIVKTAQSGTEGIDKLLTANVKGMQQALSQMNTIAKGFNTPNANIQFTNAQAGLAKAANQAAAFTKSLDGASTAAEALQGKINDIDRATAAAAKAGGAGLGSTISLNAQKDREQLTAQLAQLKKLDAEYDNLNRKAARGPAGDYSQATQNRTLAGSLVQAKALEPGTDLTNELALMTRANDEYAEAITRVRQARADELREERADAVATEKYWEDVRIAANKAAEAEEAAAAKRELQITKGTSLTSTPKAGLTTQQEIDAAYAQNEAAQRKIADAAAAKKASDMEKGFGALEAPEVPITDYNADADAFAAAQQKKVAASYAANQKIVEDTLAAQAKQAEAAERAATQLASQTASAARLLAPVNAKDALAQLGYDEAITRAKNEQRVAVQNLQKAVEEENAAAIAAGKQQLQVANSNVDSINKQNKANNPLNKPESGGLGADLLSAAKQTLIYSTLYGALAKVEGALSDGVAYAVQFQESLDTLRAISGATEGQMQQLSGTIYDVGSSSKFTTQELATAAITLAQAGESVLGVQQGIKAVSDLAAATGSTLAEAVDAVTGALNTFGLQESEQGHIADVITTAANKTKLTMTQLTQGFQTAGVAAQENGVSFEELTASLGVLATAGTKSRTAGTGLAALLQALEAPSLKLSEAVKKLGLSYDDISVKEHGLSEVLNKLRDAGFGTGDAFENLSSSAARTFLALSANPDAINNLQTQLNSVGTAGLTAAIATQSFSAKFVEFKNNLAQAASNSGVFSFFTDLATGALDAVNGYAALNKATAPLIASQAALAAQKEQLEKTSNGSDAEVEQIDKLTQQYAQYEAEIGQVVKATEDASDTSGLFTKALDDEFTAAQNASNAVQQHQQSQEALATAITQVYARQNDLKSSSSALSAETSTLIGRFAGLSQYINTSALSYDNLTLALRRYQAQQAVAGALQATTAANAAQTAGRGSADIALKTANTIAASPNIYGPEIVNLVRQLVANPNGGKGGELTNFTLLDRLTNAVNSLPPAVRDAAKITVGNFTTAFTATRQQSGVIQQNLATAGAYRFAGSTAGQGFQQEAEAAGDPKVSDASRKALINKYQTMLGQSQDKGVKLFFEGLIKEVNASLDPIAGFKEPKAKKGPRDRQPGIQTALDKGDVSAAAGVLNADLSSAKKPVTYEAFTADEDKTNKDLVAWIQAKNDALTSEIVSKKLDPAQAAQLTLTTKQEIATKTAEVARKLNETFNNFITSQLKAADEALTAALAPSKNSLAIQQGLSTSLTRDNIKDRVPDYVTALQTKRVAQAKDASDAASIPANEQYASALTKVYNDEKAQLDKLTANNDGGQNQNLIDDLNLKMVTLQNQITTVNSGVEAMKASFQGASLIPQTFANSLQQAAQAYRDAHQMNNSFSDDIKNDLGGALNEVGNDFDTFFTSVAQGTATVSEAFGSMVTAVLKYLEKLAAQMAAKAIFGQLLNLVGSSLGGVGNKTVSGVTGGTGDVDSLVGGVPGVGGNFTGGPIGYDTGGRVTNGSETHDSVDTRLAKGEWVIKKKSVDAVGNKFMANLNANGAQALAQTAAMPQVNVTGPQQNVGVYVVKPDSTPSLSKNDVLVVMHDDILKNGETKKLIQYVANGG